MSNKEISPMFPCPKCGQPVMPVQSELRGQYGSYVHDATERYECGKMTDELTLRMLGDNITLMRCAWLELHSNLRSDSPLSPRIWKLITD